MYGWEHRPGKASSAVWAENDGCTRTYGVPYSEHLCEIILPSTYPTHWLISPQASTRRLLNWTPSSRPCVREVVPTVNASTRDRRDKLRDLFRPADQADKGRIRLKERFKAVDVQRRSGC